MSAYYASKSRSHNIAVVGTDQPTRLVSALLVNGGLAALLFLMYVGLLRLLPFMGLTDIWYIHTVATISVATVMIPARRLLIKLSNRMLNRRWQDREELLREMNTTLARTLDVRQIAMLLTGDLPARLGLSHATLWMLDTPTDRMFVALGHPSDMPGATMLAQSRMITPLRYTSDYLLVPEKSDVDWAQPFRAHNVVLVFPLRVGDRLVGMYGCGHAVQGGAVAREAVQILKTLAPSIASALENTRTYAKIERLNDQLRELDLLKDQFIENVGHELRTPLTSLSLAAQVLTYQPESAPELTPVIRKSSLQLHALIARVINFSDMHNAGAQHVGGTGAIELAPMLHEIVADHQLAATTRHLTLVVHAPEGLAVWGERKRLRRAIHEIVDNAVRYGVPGCVNLSLSLRDGLVVISISDEGPGIPQEEQAQLFAAFYRGRNTRALADTPGAGVGLSIARYDIEALEGQIWLDKSDANGSTVCVALPLVALTDRSEMLDSPPLRERAVGE